MPRIAFLVALLCSFSANAQPASHFFRVEIDTFRLPQKRLAIAPFKVPARKTVGLALSGGGARGIAQIGVLKAFEDKGVPVDYLVGTSMGAIVGGLYSAGYSAAHLEELVKTLAWDDLIALRETTRRQDLFLEQKRVRDRALLTLQFDGLKLVIPKSLSAAQSLTETLDLLALAAPYHHEKSFDDLPVQFRAIATDLVTGKRETLDKGSLSAAMRASSAVPLLFLPVEINGKQLVDGGLVSNIAVDALNEFSPDVSVAVNTLGALYKRQSDVDLPWKIADQIMGIMMQEQNRHQLRQATLELKPDIGERESSDFKNLAPLIAAGYRAGLAIADSLLELVKIEQPNDLDVSGFEKEIVCPAPLPEEIVSLLHRGAKVKATLAEVLRSDLFLDAYAEVDTVQKKARYHLSPTPSVSVVMARSKRDSSFVRFFAPSARPTTNRTGQRLLEDIARELKQLFPLLRIDAIALRADTLCLTIEEGKLSEIRYELSRGWTKRGVIEKEIEFDTLSPLAFVKVERAIEGLYNAGIFNRVSLWAARERDSSGALRNALAIHLNEKFSEQLRLGFRVDDIYGAQMLVDFRNENFLGTGTELGGWFSVAERISSAQVEYQAHRLWSTYFTLYAKGFYQQRKIFATNVIFSSATATADRKQFADYGQQHYGVAFALGRQIYRDGSALIELTHQNAMLFDNDLVAPSQRLWLTSLKTRFTIDTRDSPISPTKGSYTDVYFDFYPRFLGNAVTFSKLMFSHQETRALGGDVVGRLRVHVGFADNLTPFTEQFSLGGAGASFSVPFYGFRFDDARGRQIVVAGYDMEFPSPIQLVAPTFFALHYNVGNIWAQSSRMTLREFTHGVGGELILKTPFGAARVAVAKAFRLGLPTETSPLKIAPTVYYFVFGYEL